MLYIREISIPKLIPHLSLRGDSPVLNHALATPFTGKRGFALDVLGGLGMDVWRG